MRKEQITDREAFCLLFLFISGSTLILGIGAEAKNDAWMSAIVGALLVLPMISIYARIISLFPGKDLFEIVECVLGKVLGKIVSLIYIWYAFHLGAMVIRNFGAFIKTVAMPETPIRVSLLGLGLLCIYVVKSGVEVMARFSTYLFPLVVVIIVVVQLLAIPSFEPEFLKPILGNGLVPILKGGYSAFTFPFAETILLTGAFFSLKNKKSPYKVYFPALLFTCLLIVALIIRNIMILGGTISFAYFPSHEAVSRIHVGDFIQRIELTVALVFMVGVFIKSALCLLVASRGVANVFKLQDYRSIVTQVGLLMIFLSEIVYEDIMMMEYWAFKVYPYYVFPFQVILPLAIWITAEVRKKKLNCQSTV